MIRSCVYPCHIFFTATSLVEARTAVTQPSLRGAIEKSLPLLMTGALGHRENRTCFACHQAGAADFCPDRGTPARLRDRRRRAGPGNRRSSPSFSTAIARTILLGKGTGGQADTAGYALWALAAAGWKPDADDGGGCRVFAAAAQGQGVLAEPRRTARPRKPGRSRRPTSLCMACRRTARRSSKSGLRPERRRCAIGSPKHPPRTTKIASSGCGRCKRPAAPASEIAAAAKELLSKQRDDGGWAQLDSGEPARATESDAYATGTALVALHEAGGLATADPAYQKGLAYLLKTQQDDGSWHVVSRSKPFQPYYESGFPHGKDQFISCAASGWATWAMVLASGSSQ